MLRHPEDGRSKLFLICTVLGLRRRQPTLFERGDYVAVTAEGVHAKRIVAFARRNAERGVIAVAPRLFAELCERPGSLPFGAQVWGDTGLPLPWLGTGVELRDVISGRPAVVEGSAQGTRLPVGELLTAFPVALLEYSTSPATHNTEDTESGEKTDVSR